MEVIYSLIPGMMFFGLIFLAVLIWAVKKGQYEDMEGNASRILLDDDEDAMLISQPNGHDRNATPEDETCHARSPLPNPLDETTSHSTRLQETAAKSLVIPQAGEGANESLRELQVKAEAEAQEKTPPATKQ